jgi:NADH:ubiquinone oxidoreductase subunit H
MTACSTRSTHRAALVAGAVALVIGAACGSPEFPAVRDIRPTTAEPGDVLVVELDPAQAAVTVGAPTQVVLTGALTRAEGEDEPENGNADRDEETTVALPARAVGPQRVLIDIDDHVASLVGGRAAFEGRIAVQQAPAAAGDPRVIAESGEAPWRLRFFPGTVRGVAHDLIGQRGEQQLLDWLGVELEPVEDGPGVRVAWVQQGFEGLPFVNRYDCGRWNEAKKMCVGGPDARVHLGEAEARGFADRETLEHVDADGDGAIDRHDIHHYLEEHGVDAATDPALEPAPAAAAGLRTGDVIVAASGTPIESVGGLARAWDQQAAGVTIPLTVMRDGKQVVPAPAVARYGRPASIPSGFLMAGLLVAVGLLVVLPVPLLGGLIVVWERKISGYIQSRPGPNRVGPNGWLQWLADGVKLIVKEDIIPRESDSLLFRASPFLVFTGVFATFVVLPFSPFLQVADLNIGVLYLLSVTSVVVVGVIMGGWASNSKWSLLGGMRSAAQIISYELPASIAVLTVVIMTGSLSTQDIVRGQGGAPWEWNVFDNPFAFACFFIFFISALAEGNRTPFDLPEAESELVAGYNTEYSGFRFSIFALAEWVNLVVIGSVVSLVFLGGWNIPFVDPAQIEAGGALGGLHLLAFALFAAKVVFIVFVCIWIRWTLPRFRVDHMMNMCWKYFLPFSLASLMGAAVWVWVLPPIAREVAQWMLFLGGGVGIAFVFVQRVRFARRTTEIWELRGA